MLTPEVDKKGDNPVTWLVTFTTEAEFLFLSPFYGGSHIITFFACDWNFFEISKNFEEKIENFENLFHKQNVL